MYSSLAARASGGRVPLHLYYPCYGTVVIVDHMDHYHFNLVQTDFEPLFSALQPPFDVSE